MWSIPSNNAEGEKKEVSKNIFLIKLFIKVKTAILNNMLIRYNMYIIMLFLKEKKHFTFFRF